MLFQHGRHIIVQVILLINIVPQPQANIPQVISLCYVGPDKSRYQRFYVRKGFLRNFTKFTGKHLYQALFFNKVADLRPKACNIIKKENLAQVLSCELCDISKKTFFAEHLWATTSALMDPDKIVNYFSVKSCLRTVYQQYAGKCLVQFWLRQIKTTLYMVIFLRKDDYKQKQPFADAFQNRCS